MHSINIPEDIKEEFRYAIERAREGRPLFFERIKNEIETAITLINKFDKIYVIGGLASRLIKCVPTLYNQFLGSYNGLGNEEIQEDDLIQEDDDIEILLEYVMNLATATANTNKNVIPSLEDIQSIYDQLSKIKSSVNFWELSAENPVGGDEFDYWLRTHIMMSTMNVRGDGYHTHIEEIYKEVFQPFDGFLEQYYGFNSDDIYNTILKLDSLVYSKVGNLFGATQSHKRFTDWMNETDEDTIMKTMMETGKHFIRQFTDANPDLYDEQEPDKVISHHLDSVESYGKLFWVIPKSAKEKLIFEKLSIEFGANGIFFQPPKFKGFLLNDTLTNLNPLIKEDEKYFHFSVNLAFRNIFKITEELIKSADAVYYDNSFKGNSNSQSRDNYIELKTKKQFEKLLPTATFYHSLEYNVVEDGQLKKTELDIIGVSSDTVYIIEVKAGELNIKHRRGALKGLKDRLEETINEGSYQCHRALKYIQDNENPTFDYSKNGTTNTLTVNKNQIKSYFKISVTFEHFSSISANLKYLINSGVLSPDFKWTWIVSLYDLMIFSDLIQSEDEFKEYLTNRIALYDRNDIEFSDEIDILGFYLENKFPLGPEKQNEMVQIVNFKDKIDTYYTKKGVGMPEMVKPKKK